jgi:hypothetical protein
VSKVDLCPLCRKKFTLSTDHRIDRLSAARKRSCAKCSYEGNRAEVRHAGGLAHRKRVHGGGAS